MRLWIFGAPGSGKSTLARSLAERFSVPAYHLDDSFWLPGWVIEKPESFRAKVSAMSAEDEWIIEGNYTSSAPILTERASAAIWLDLPFRVTYFRVLKRTMQRLHSQTELCNGNRESLSRILRIDGMPAYALLKHRRNRRRFLQFWNGFPKQKQRLQDAGSVEASATAFCSECIRDNAGANDYLRLASHPGDGITKPV